MIYPDLAIGAGLPVLYATFLQSGYIFLGQSEGRVSRLEALKSAEKGLSKVREMVKHPNDAMLRYLIDMAIAEAQSCREAERDPEKRQRSAIDQPLGSHRPKLTVYESS